MFIMVAWFSLLHWQLSQGLKPSPGRSKSESFILLLEFSFPSVCPSIPIHGYMHHGYMNPHAYTHHVYTHHAYMYHGRSHLRLLVFFNSNLSLSSWPGSPRFIGSPPQGPKPRPSRSQPNAPKMARTVTWTSLSGPRIYFTPPKYKK